MRNFLLTFLLLLSTLFTALPASSFDYATGDCATGGCASGEDWEASNANEIDAALDALEARFITGTPATLGTSTINSLACATVVTATATGAATTDVIAWSFNADVSGVTGYAPATAGGLIIYDYPTTNTVNFKVCNPTGSPITPGAVTLNWIIVR